MKVKAFLKPWGEAFLTATKIVLAGHLAGVGLALGAMMGLRIDTILHNLPF